MRAKSIHQWINNSSSLGEIIRKDYIPYAADSIDLWRFSNDRSQSEGIINYLNYMWSFMSIHEGIVYDVEDFEVNPGDKASCAFFNTGLMSSVEYGPDFFFAIFSKADTVWHLNGLFIRGYNDIEYRELLRQRAYKSVLPVHYKKPLLNEVRVERIRGSHFYCDNIHRTTTRFKNTINSFAPDDTVAQHILYCNWVLWQRIRKSESEPQDLFAIEHSNLLEIWYAGEAKGNDFKCKNPRLDFVFPVFDLNQSCLDGCICLKHRKSKDGIQTMTVKTLFTPKMAYRDALLLKKHNELASSWLNKSNVEQSIQDGCEE